MSKIFDPDISGLEGDIKITAESGISPEKLKALLSTIEALPEILEIIRLTRTMIESPKGADFDLALRMCKLMRDLDEKHGVER